MADTKQDIPLNPITAEKVPVPTTTAIPQGVPDLLASAPPVTNPGPTAVPPSTSSEPSLSEKHSPSSAGGLFKRKKAKAKKEDKPVKEESHPPVKFSTLFRYATKGELALNGIGLILAIMAGATTVSRL